MAFKKSVVQQRRRPGHPSLPEKTQIWVEIKGALTDINTLSINPIEVIVTGERRGDGAIKET